MNTNYRPTVQTLSLRVECIWQRIQWQCSVRKLTARIRGDAPSSDDTNGGRWKHSVIDADRFCLSTELDTGSELKQRDVVFKCVLCEVTVYDNPAYLIVPFLRPLTSAYIMRFYHHRKVFLGMLWWTIPLNPMWRSHITSSTHGTFIYTLYKIVTCKIMAITPFKVVQGHRFWYQSKAHNFMRLFISD